MYKHIYIVIFGSHLTLLWLNQRWMQRVRLYLGWACVQAAWDHPPHQDIPNQNGVYLPMMKSDCWHSKIPPIHVKTYPVFPILAFGENRPLKKNIPSAPPKRGLPLDLLSMICHHHYRSKVSGRESSSTRRWSVGAKLQKKIPKPISIPNPCDFCANDTAPLKHCTIFQLLVVLLKSRTSTTKRHKVRQLRRKSQERLQLQAAAFSQHIQ